VTEPVLQRACLSCSCKHFGHKKTLVKSLLISTLDKVHNLLHWNIFTELNKTSLHFTNKWVETSWTKIARRFQHACSRSRFLWTQHNVTESVESLQEKARMKCRVVQLSYSDSLLRQFHSPKSAAILFLHFLNLNGNKVMKRSRHRIRLGIRRPGFESRQAILFYRAIIAIL
jgi:hypothetical protein